jgi:hypothetical protein
MIRRMVGKLMRSAGLDFERFLEASAAAQTLQARLALLADPRNGDPRRLLKYGHKIYSQNDEDGIIAEIFRRVGTQSKRFLEIGVGNGCENNTVALLLQGWSGGWIDGSPNDARAIRERFSPLLSSGKLQFIEGFVTAETIAKLAAQPGLDDLDLFSIDIDGNEYHILQAMHLTARVVIVEYNAKFAPPIDWVMPYKADFVWGFTDYCSASLTALERLMRSKNYSLVGCNITGVNAFFVRDDLAGESFLAPFTAENHYEPARYWMTPGFVSGYPPGVPFPLP